MPHFPGSAAQSTANTTVSTSNIDNFKQIHDNIILNDTDMSQN